LNGRPVPAIVVSIDREIVEAMSAACGQIGEPLDGFLRSLVNTDRLPAEFPSAAILVTYH